MANDGVACSPVSEIPDKLYFKIGEVSELLGVEPTSCATGKPNFPRCHPRNPARAIGYTGVKMSSCCCGSSTCCTRNGSRLEARAVAAAAARAPKPRATERVQQELFTEDPLPEIRRELADILQILK